MLVNSKATGSSLEQNIIGTAINKKENTCICIPMFAQRVDFEYLLLFCFSQVVQEQTSGDGNLNGRLIPCCVGNISAKNY